MAELSPLTVAEVKKLVDVWYKQLDVHAPMVEVLPMLFDEGLEMVFPEVTSRGYVGFEEWYQRVIRIFFDEVHSVKLAEVALEDGGQTAHVEVVVQWEASVWSPPAASSARIKLDAFQRWVVKRSPATGAPAVLTYIVDRIEYHDGSAKL